MVKEFENEFGKIFSKVASINGQNAVLVAWQGYTTKHQVETVLQWLEEQIKLTPFDTIVNDCTGILSVWEDSIGWVSRVWAHKMMLMGLKRFIHIAKSDSFGEKIGHQLEYSLINQLSFKSFGNRTEAIHWLDAENLKGSPEPTNSTGTKT